MSNLSEGIMAAREQMHQAHLREKETRKRELNKSGKKGVKNNGS